MRTGGHLMFTRLTSGFSTGDAIRPTSAETQASKGQKGAA